MKNRDYEYDVALSFAGENRNYVEGVALSLKRRNIKVFYDLFEETNLWGKNLYEYLSEIYQNKARYTVLFISDFYNKKLWTNHERNSMQARAFQESKEYILPARFDDTEIPGMLRTVGYIDLNQKTPEEFAEIIEKKVKKEQTSLKSRWSKISTLINPKPFVFTIKILNTYNEVVQNAKVVLVAKNSTYLEGFSDNDGLAHFVMSTKKLYTVLIASPEYPSVVLKDINPKEDIEVILSNYRQAGAMVIHKSGDIAGLSGKLKPVIKQGGQMLLYADNIAINGGKDQPFDFQLNKSISLEDHTGTSVDIIFRFFQGRIALIDYHK